MEWNLPKIARQTMSDEKINKSFADANLPKQIEDAFTKADVKKDIINKVSANLKGQIESMIYGIGKYKNVRQVLPETLSEIDRMEGLVKEILSISRME